MVPSVTSARTLTPKVKVEVEEDDGTEPRVMLRALEMPSKDVEQLSLAPLCNKR